MSTESRGTSSLFAGFAGLGIILYMLVSVLLTEGNIVGHLCMFLLVAGFIMGMIAPRGTLVVWLVGCGYLDFLKRLMVVSGRIFQDDLFYVLGVAPATFAGIATGVVLHGFFGTVRLTSRHAWFLVVACLVVVASALMSIRTSGASLRSLGPDVANAGLYALMLFVIPVLYQDRAALLGLFRLVLFAWIPVMLYGVYQLAYGFQQFEIDYLKTGLSIEIKQLFSDRVRAFSTLNSPTALGTIGGALCAVAVVLGGKPGEKKARRYFVIPLAWALAAVFAAGMFASTVRTSFMIPLAGLAAGWAFRYRGFTGMLYLGVGLVFALLVLSADFILSRIAVWNDLAATGIIGRTLGQEFMGIATFSDRLMGFRNILLNPDAYTFFGYGMERGLDPRDPLYNHDLLSNLIVRYGCVPLVLLAIACLLAGKRVHGAVHRIPDGEDRRVAAGMLGIAFSTFAASMLSGNVLATFPNNVMFWLLIATTAALAFAPVRSRPPVAVPAPPPAPPTAALGARVAAPLRPSRRQVDLS